MALVVYGGPLSAMSGKLGGSVAARNRAGAYWRNYAKPTNTPTTSQTNRRVSFAAQSAGWSALSESDKGEWNSWASGLTVLNRLGSAYIPTGRQMYMSINQNLAVVSAPPLTLPPSGASPPTIKDGIVLSMAADGSVFDNITIINGDANSDIKWSIWGSPQQTGGKSNMTTTFRIIGTFDTGSPIQIKTEYEAIFGATAIIGALVQIKFRAINVTTGLSSPFLIIAGAIE